MQTSTAYTTNDKGGMVDCFLELRSKFETNVP
jgi:hypothetical protein